MPSEPRVLIAISRRNGVGCLIRQIRGFGQPPRKALAPVDKGQKLKLISFQQSSTLQSILDNKLSPIMVFAGSIAISLFFIYQMYLRYLAMFPGEELQLQRDILYVLKRDPSLAPLFIRLVFNQNGSHIYAYSCNTSSANTASLRYPGEHTRPEHKGLYKAMEILENVRGAHPFVSAGDVWTLAASLAIEFLGGPLVVDTWKFGRVDSTTDKLVAPLGLLPKAEAHGEEGCLNNLSCFLRMGFSIKECVALMGAHTVGRMHPENSGYEGQWTDSPFKFDNEYFRNLATKEWVITKKQGLNPQYKAKGGNVHMLPADVALLQNSKTRHWVKVFAEDEDEWRASFAEAWTKLCELNQWRSLKPPKKDREVPIWPSLALDNLKDRFRIFYEPSSALKADERALMFQPASSDITYLLKRLRKLEAAPS